MSSTAAVDLNTFNKVVTERNRLSQTLKKLQQASKQALEDFKRLKSDHRHLQEERIYFQQQLHSAHGERNQLRHQLTHAEDLLRRVCQVSRSAIVEFNDLKQRYVDEVQKRQQADQLVFEFSRKLEALGGSQALQASRVQSFNSGQLEKELASMKVQLGDTVKAFQDFRLLANKKQEALEYFIKDEFERLWTRRDDRKKREAMIQSVATQITNTDSIIADPTESLTSPLIEQLSKDHAISMSEQMSAAERNQLTQSIKGEQFSELNTILVEKKEKDRDRQSSIVGSPPPPLPPKRRDTKEKGPAQALIAQLKPVTDAHLVQAIPNQLERAEEENIPASIDTSPSDKVVDHTKQVVSDELDGEDDIALWEIAEELMQATKDTQHSLDRSSARVLQSAGLEPISAVPKMDPPSKSRHSELRKSVFQYKVQSMATSEALESIRQSALQTNGVPSPTLDQAEDNAIVNRTSLDEIQDLFQTLETELGIPY